MLSGEGNENAEKTTVRLISKIATLHVMHISLSLSCTSTTWNYQKLPSYTFYGGKCRTCFCSLFFPLPLIFPLVAASIFHFLATATKFSCFSSNKKCLLFFSLSLAFCRSFSGRPSPACRPFSLFLCLSLSLFFKFVDMTINLSLIL